MSRSHAPALISAVRSGSLAALAGIEPGDAVLTVGGRAMRDVVDFQFTTAEREVEIGFRKATGIQDTVVFEKEIDEDLGLEFEHATWDDVIVCNNNCFFCFLKGLPRGLRKSLYIKDDDYRLSFLHGNFVTLTNLSEADWDRLEEQRLSPLNVSVHATDLALRRRMLANPSAPDVIQQLQRLSALRIRAHTQVVLCPGINDGAALDQTVRDLGSLYPCVQTISVVPVGASPALEAWAQNRDGIDLQPPDPLFACNLIRQVRRLQRELRSRYGATILHCSDEYYVTAAQRVPAAGHYDGYPQYENGVGMVRSMFEDWRRARRRLIKAPLVSTGLRVLVASGTLAAPVLATIAGELQRLSGATVDVHAVHNTVFGPRVNVSGLVCGRDYVAQLPPGSADLAILPRPSLDFFGRKFLDGMTVEECQAALKMPVAFASQWSEVVDMLRGGPRPPMRNLRSNGAFWSEEPVRIPRRAVWVRS